MFNQFFRDRFGQKRDESGPGSDRSRGLGRETGQGRGRGGGNKTTSGPGGNCVCPKCGHKEPHVAGQRCMDKVCPSCGTKMVRE
jgi:hypothetical protein